MDWERIKAAAVVFVRASFGCRIALAAIPVVATVLPDPVANGFAVGGGVAIAVALSGPIARAHASRGVSVGKTVSVWLALGLVTNLLVQSTVDTLRTGGILLLIAAQFATAVLAAGGALARPDLSSATVWKASLGIVGTAAAVDVVLSL